MTAEEGDDLSVLVVDDHRSFAEALAVSLRAQPGVRVAVAATSVAEAVDRLGDAEPDVVLMDVLLPGVDGIEGTRRVLARRPACRVVVLTGYADVDVLVRAAEAGASGFLPKETPFDEVLAAVRDPEARRLGDGPVLRQVVERARGRTAPVRTPSEPTTREREVLALLAEGADLRTIAGMLGISEHTCRRHAKNLMAKLGAHSQLQAVVVAARAGLLPGHPLGSVDRTDG